MNPVELAYLAGIIDGEGCISIPRWKNPKRARRIVLTVTMKQPEAVWELSRIFGGRVNKVDKKYIRWTIGNQNAADALTNLLPYLRVKHEEAVLALKFQDSVNENRDNYRLPDGVREWREQIATEIAALKRREYDNGVLSERPE
jgi:hypothetical protein